MRIEVLSETLTWAGVIAKHKPRQKLSLFLGKVLQCDTDAINPDPKSATSAGRVSIERDRMPLKAVLKLVPEGRPCCL